MQTEEKRIQNYVSFITDKQLAKFYIKLSHFEELESILDQERESLALQKQQIIKVLVVYKHFILNMRKYILFHHLFHLIYTLRINKHY